MRSDTLVQFCLTVSTEHFPHNQSNDCFLCKWARLILDKIPKNDPKNIVLWSPNFGHLKEIYSNIIWNGFYSTLMQNRILFHPVNFHTNISALTDFPNPAENRTLAGYMCLSIDSTEKAVVTISLFQVLYKYTHTHRYCHWMWRDLWRSMRWKENCCSQCDLSKTPCYYWGHHLTKCFFFCQD